MKYLALDLGTKTGYCYGSEADALAHGTKNFKKKKFEKDGDRFLNFHVWLRDLIRNEKPDFVYFEDVKSHSGNLAARVYCGLLSQVQMICVAEGVICKAEGVGTIKKHATGNGRASKEMMIEAAEAKVGKVKDDNEADAVCLWHCAREPF
jgi:Holliday junction resolvasome RuvABC endonuclease subunit